MEWQSKPLLTEDARLRWLGRLADPRSSFALRALAEIVLWQDDKARMEAAQSQPDEAAP